MLLFTCGEKKIYSSIKLSPNIMNIVLALKKVGMVKITPPQIPTTQYNNPSQQNFPSPPHRVGFPPPLKENPVVSHPVSTWTMKKLNFVLFYCVTDVYQTNFSYEIFCINICIGPTSNNIYCAEQYKNICIGTDNLD